ncbi:MAG TPA: methyltransferase domain-containing protein [Pirellulales bacterium]|nr:methyltransferase domain-containing protein [Pirellulales bacterium]
MFAASARSRIATLALLRRWLLPFSIALVALLTSAAIHLARAQAPAVPAAGDATAPKADATPAADPLPAPLTHYQGREIAMTMHYEGAGWLTRESRDREEDTRTLLGALHVKPGQSVCDLGCGNGFYTLQLAKRVGEKGTVYAVDIQPEMLHLLDVRAKSVGHKNIKPVLGNRVDPALPAAQLDMVLLVDVYHELSNPAEMLHAIRASLKPDGRMVLAEFRLEDPEVPIKLLHKMSKEQILKEILPAGFRLVEQFDDLPWQHLMFFGPTLAAEPGR